MFEFKFQKCFKTYPKSAGAFAWRSFSFAMPNRNTKCWAKKNIIFVNNVSHLIRILSTFSHKKYPWYQCPLPPSLLAQPAEPKNSKIPDMKFCHLRSKLG